MSAEVYKKIDKIFETLVRYSDDTFRIINNKTDSVNIPNSINEIDSNIKRMMEEELNNKTALFDV